MRIDHRRRHFTLGLATLPWLGTTAASASQPVMEVWRSATCGCCKDWISYLGRNGLAVKSHETGNAAMRARLGVRSMYGSCHTGLIDGYVVEGHVPVREIRRLLKERPDAIGIAVPAMPLGSPGMDGPAYGNKTEPYAVVLLTRDGQATVYQRYP
jgi:hypothetical protein